MKRRWPCWIALCALCISGGTSAQINDQRAGATTAQVLVMLRTAPPHMRAADDYVGNYTATPDETARRRIAQRLARDYRLQLVNSWPMPALGLDCFVMQLAPGSSARQVAQALSQDARVESAEPMQLFHVLAKVDPLYRLQPTASEWHLAELHTITTGKSVTIAELDSGVDTTNPDLIGQVALTQNFVDDAPHPAELHGTEVAGIIVAREGNGVGIAGVAPGARLLALRACWQTSPNDASATCSSFTLAKAMQYALEHNPQVINLSLAGPDDRLLERLLDVALSRRITIIGAIDNATADGGFPAAYPGVLAVTDEHATRVPINDALRAPGEDIPTTLPGANWNFVTGSSFSAAEVSGLVALLRALSPDIAPAQLRNDLKAKTALGLAAMRPTAIDACAAVARASGSCTCNCATANASLAVPRR
jgi:subtilisin family serine protease